MEPLVSVLMPVYNAEKYLSESIESILNQTYKNFELIIVNDGSDDSSKSIIKEFLVNDKRIKYVENEENKGLPYTRNKMLTLANGEYIALMDADDISLPTRIEEQVSYMLKNRNIIVLGTDFEVFEEGKRTKKNKKGENVSIPYIDLLFGSIVCNPSAMIRKEFLVKNGIEYDRNCKIAQDYKLWTDIALKKGEFGHLSKILLRYRFGHENITKKSTINLNSRKEILRKIYGNYLLEYGFLLEDEEITTYLKFFADTSLYEKIANKDILNILNLYIKMSKQLESNDKLYFKNLFKSKLQYTILFNKNSKLVDKYINLKIIYKYFLEKKNPLKVVLIWKFKEIIKRILNY